MDPHLEVNLKSLHWEAEQMPHKVMEHCFAVAFLLELCYRVYSERCKYFKEGMNIFDTVRLA